MTSEKTIDERTIITLSRSSIFGAAVEASSPFQLIESITAEIAAAIARVAASILAIGRRPYMSAAGILLKRRREALMPK